MGVKERREREKSETRDKILDAARELFSVHGYDGVSMRQVAEKIEYSPTAIYLHFADKKDLFKELCQEDFARLAAEFQKTPLPADSIERIKQIGRSNIAFGIQRPNHYKLMFMTPHPASELDEADQEIQGNPEVDAYALLMQTVHEALAEGRFRPELGNADLIAQTLWSAVHGVISLDIAKRQDQWVEWRPFAERQEAMLDIILRGMLKEGH
jgi:AcrR family transcriptional regulator